MPSFDFKPNFVPSILAGTKVQTIRAMRRCGPGDSMHLFTGLRTKGCIKLALRPCIVSDCVHLSPDGITLGDASKHPHDIDEFSQLDGFEDYAEMWGWFSRQYAAPHFIGYVHRWAREPVTAVKPTDKSAQV